MSACFDFEFVPTPVGLVPRPILPVTFTGPDGNVNVVAMLDSGSDVIMIPRSIGEVIGFNPTPDISSYGVSGSVAGKIFNAQVTLAGQTFTAPVFVSVEEDVPILVGRAGVWDKFQSFTFYNDARQLCFGAAAPHPFVPWTEYAALGAAGVLALILLLR